MWLVPEEVVEEIDRAEKAMSVLDDITEKDLEEKPKEDDAGENDAGEDDDGEWEFK